MAKLLKEMVKVKAVVHLDLSLFYSAYAITFSTCPKIVVHILDGISPSPSTGKFVLKTISTSYY
jgi:hypothetical protein